MFAKRPKSAGAGRFFFSREVEFPAFVCSTGDTAAGHAVSACGAWKASSARVESGTNLRRGTVEPLPIEIPRREKGEDVNP